MDNAPPPPQLSLDSTPDGMDDRAARLRAELDHLDMARAAAITDALARIRAARTAHAQAGESLDEAVAEAYGFGATWQQIADAAGMKRPSAWKRWADRG